MSRIVGCGHYLPEREVDNFELSKSLDTTDEWIFSRTGIKSRRIGAEKEYTSHLGLKSLERALRDASLEKSDLDIIIVCTTTPDESFPSVAAKIQGYLGIGEIPAFDLQAVCSGFVYGLETADSLIASGRYKTIALVCAEKMSSLLDWNDRSTCVLFGDGAGSVILRPSDEKSGLVDSKIYSDGSYYPILRTTGGVSSTGESGKIEMKGSVLFKRAVEKMAESISFLLQKNKLSVEDIDYLVPHQANIRIINSVAEKIGLPKEKAVITVDRHANCSAASIPMALAEFKLSGKLRKGDLLLFCSFGAGLTWGASLLRW